MFDPAARILDRLRQPMRLAIAVLVLWFVGESLLYRSGIYYWLAEPNSNTGAVVRALMLLEQEYRAEARTVLVFGDSRVGEGFSARLAKADGPIDYINLSVPGSSPRTWYYLLREINRRGYRYDAVLVGTQYRPRHPVLRADWVLDPQHHAALVGLTDLFSYPAEVPSPEMRARARHAVLAPSLTMRADTMQLLAAPHHRMRAVLRQRPAYLRAVPGYGGRDEVMPPIQITAAGEVQDWAGASPAQRAQVEGHLKGERTAVNADIQTANDAYLTRWLQGIATLAQAQRARTVLFPLPRGPYAEAYPVETASALAERALRGSAATTLLPDDLFDDLEDPAFFFDVLHLNRAGRERMSTRLGQEMRRLLGDGAP